ncbi:hypothetical protein [Alicyclobacillus macrosporangiidus]|uniref:Uncharacterized protein n=1 Tax=Alicyclobacillus macrosporangiidus TaxID=392015 RepID=A0A1I7HCG4_9BACL|nr:hypothetical protein [Alicyclobacillus macrosporangiidus]SFU58408.1 hypothetical protein SAMN05421543_104115 [Alicyclobacillus macrosporangiidus]
MINRTRNVRYLLFTLAFALVLVGLLTHSYTLLAILAIVSIALAVIGDKIENEPSEPFKHLNENHHHFHHGARRS